MENKIKNLFVWIFTTVGLILLIIGSVRLLNIGLSEYVFIEAAKANCPIAMPAAPAPDGKVIAPNPDYQKECEDGLRAQRQRDLADSLAFVIVGLPLFIFFYKRANAK